MAENRINYTKLFEALDQARTLRGLSWRQVVEETGVPGGTFVRMKQGATFSDSTLVSLLVWLGAHRSLKRFVEKTSAHKIAGSQRA
jgi:hypothetical protein